VRLPKTERSKRGTIQIGRRRDTIAGSATETRQTQGSGTPEAG
jgi:hypothetical protein